MTINKVFTSMLICLQISTLNAKCGFISVITQNICFQKEDTIQGVTAIWETSPKQKTTLMYIKGFGFPHDSKEKRPIHTDAQNANAQAYLADVENTIKHAEHTVFKSIKKDKLNKLLTVTDGNLILNISININDKGNIDAVRIMVFGKDAANLFDAKDILRITNDLTKKVHFKNPKTYSLNSIYFSFALSRKEIKKWQTE